MIYIVFQQVDYANLIRKKSGKSGESGSGISDFRKFDIRFSKIYSLLGAYRVFLKVSLHSALVSFLVSLQRFHVN